MYATFGGGLHIVVMSSVLKLQHEKQVVKLVEAPPQRLLGGGVPLGSSPAFRFVPNPNATLVLSPPTEFPPVSAVAAEIREKPALGAGDAIADISALLLPETGKGCGSVMKASAPSG